MSEPKISATEQSITVSEVRKAAATADMRIEVVKRELNQGALAGFDSSVTNYAAQLVVSALDSFDEEALAAEFRRGFELGDANAQLLAEDRGYRRAVQALRDSGRYEKWAAEQSGCRCSNCAADYLESLAAAPREDTT